MDSAYFIRFVCIVWIFKLNVYYVSSFFPVSHMYVLYMLSSLSFALCHTSLIKHATILIMSIADVIMHNTISVTIIMRNRIIIKYG